MSFDAPSKTIATISDAFHAADLIEFVPGSADRIAQCVREKFDQLTKDDLRLRRCTVLAGVVLTRQLDLQTMQIICITTGTKCLPSDRRRSSTGQLLNDCHAEILARRCLKRFCYEQVKLAIDGRAEESIFERSSSNGRLRLRPSMAFHLYISMAPCGDSRLFSLEESSSARTSRRGFLRRKIEMGEGTIPLGLRIDEQPVTMSCSDKLCRWNFIGFQGALLSTLIDPIYFHSVILGNLYDGESLRRALYARIEQVTNIPLPYGLRQPLISRVSQPNVRTTGRAPHYAMMWTCVDQHYEVVDIFTGLTTTRSFVEHRSRVSKAALFQQWMELCGSVPMDYRDAKQLAVDYQRAKKEVCIY